MVGAGQRVLEITVNYFRKRYQFDMPIGINQCVQDHCVHRRNSEESPLGIFDIPEEKRLTYWQPGEIAGNKLKKEKKSAGRRILEIDRNG